MNEKITGTRIIERPGQASELFVRQIMVRVIGGPQQGVNNLVGIESIRIGSSPDADMVLVDPTISKFHVALRMTELGCEIHDLGSKNGTFIDGIRISQVYITNDIQIQIGSTLLKLEWNQEEVALPLARITKFGDMLGHSPIMRSIFALLEQAAKSDATLLIHGESGTGKELAARAVHEKSSRKEKPFIIFDCAGVAPTLIESQLFGHIRGAFTGATESRAGVFEEADEGTLVLDEIGELPLELQPKLLRVLEERSVQRVGENKRRPLNIRFIACTNRNLREEVRASRFRQDLFYRLSVLTTRLPSLRERKEEIPRLIAYFLERFQKNQAHELPENIMTLLCSYDWPGNVRELRNFVERFLAMPEINMAMLFDNFDSTSLTNAQTEMLQTSEHLWDAPFHEVKAQMTDKMEREYLRRLLEKYGTNITEAARVSGLSRQSCYRLMHKHGLRVEE